MLSFPSLRRYVRAHILSLLIIPIYYVGLVNISIKSQKSIYKLSLRWRHNDHAGVSNHQPHGCLLNRLFRRKSKKTSKPRITGLCAGNSTGTGEFPAQMASYAENVSIWWRHHVRIKASVYTLWHNLEYQWTPHQRLFRGTATEWHCN